VLLGRWGAVGTASDLCLLLLLYPDPLQCLPELIGARGWGDQVSFQCLAEHQDLDGKGNRKHRPGHQDPDGVGRHAAYFLTPSWGVVLCCPFI